METTKPKRKIFVISSSEDEEEQPKKKPLRSLNPKVKSETNIVVANGNGGNKPSKLLSNAKKLQALVDKKKSKHEATKLPKPRPRVQPSFPRIASKSIPKIPKIKKEDNTTKETMAINTITKTKGVIKVEPKPTASYDTKSSKPIKCDPIVPIASIDKRSLEPLWQEYEILENEHRITPKVARNIVNLFKDGNTIPFIARYRKEAIGQMTPDELRNVKNTYENTLELKQKIVSAYAKIHDMGKMNDKLAKSLLDARSLDTLDEIYAPYKPDGDGKLKRQMHAALEVPANLILDGTFCDLAAFVGRAQGLETLADVEKHITMVLAKKIVTTSAILQFLQKMKKDANCTLQTKKINKRTVKVEKKTIDHKNNKHKDELKFADYYDRSFSSHQLKPHQIMAINRGEHLKFLNVKMEFNDFSQQFFLVARNNWKEAAHGPMSSIYETALQECYKHIVIPLLKRIKRTELKSFAEKASLEIFAGNLKQILLATPVKGRKILGVDPGFTHGCKLGVISDTGSLLATGVVYPHSNDKKKLPIYEKMFKDILIDHNCSLIALGNGTACRETEAWITDMIARGVFQPLDVSYTIVNESGASVYSCSLEATKEFKTLDPNKISAVSLARRVQEPLAELVKIDPKHLGIGMYQHDINQKRLEEALAEVVSECVSFVGIDINTASQCLLKYVAGLSDRRATEIIAYREENGPFETREELLKVKGIGPHTFKQCAGFLKIINGTNKLDATIVHPESYDVAENIIKELKLGLCQIGDEGFMTAIKREQGNLMNQSVNGFKTSVEDFETILDGLSKPLNYDLRDDGSRKPLFRQGVTNITALKIRLVLTGVINNVTSFGYFVDIGVGTSGLLHSKNTNGVKLQIGDHVEVRVCNLEISRGRIGLELVQRLM